MYSLRSKLLLKPPQAAMESGACGSSMAINRRALGCAMGTNRAPATRLVVVDVHWPLRVVR